MQVPKRACIFLISFSQFLTSHATLLHKNIFAKKSFRLPLSLVKIIAFILSLYILLLSGMPCTDAQDCNLSTTTQVSATQNHDNHQHESEHCPPLCHCSCCSVAVSKLPTFALVYKKLPLANQLKFSFYHSHYLTGFLEAVWQPPKYC